jgi:hypothetical protein
MRACAYFFHRFSFIPRNVIISQLRSTSTTRSGPRKKTSTRPPLIHPPGTWVG